MNRRRKINKGDSFIYLMSWTDRELLDLATAIQKYGSSETASISEFIKTKSEGQVRQYLNSKKKILKKTYLEEKRKVRNKEYVNTNALLPDDVKDWPPIRKWTKIAKNQSARRQRIDYSKEVIRNMFEDFYEEAEETTNPQLVDVKAIYKFLFDCVSGKNPAELMPKESGIILMLLKKLKEMKNNFDLNEEQKFIVSFKKATKFVPFNGKVLAENLDSEVSDEEDPTGVPIPNEVYTIFNRHKRIIESFNPLLVPLWLLDKEQSYLHQMLQSIIEK